MKLFKKIFQKISTKPAIERNELQIANERGEKFSRALETYAEFRYARDSVFSTQIPARVYARRYELLGKHFSFLIAGEQGEAWYGKGDNLSSIRTYAPCIREGNVVLDVGAHQGFFTMAYRALVGEKGAVYAVEPFDHLSDVIRFNAALNRFSNVSVLNCGFSGKQGIEKITSISIKSAVHQKYAHFMISLYLDDFAALKPDFVKMDIEGYEIEAFQNADLFLKTQPIFLISVHTEFIQIRLKKDYQSIFDTLQKHGYVFGKLDAKGNFSQKTIASMAHPVCFDVLAVPVGKVAGIHRG